MYIALGLIDSQFTTLAMFAILLAVAVIFGILLLTGRLGSILTILVMFPYFFLLNTGAAGNPLLIIAAQMLVYACVNSPGGTLKALFVESFPTKYRYSGMGITYNLGSLVTGVLVSLILPVLLMTYGVGDAWIRIVGVAIALAVISIIASFFTKETRGIPLE